MQPQLFCRCLCCCVSSMYRPQCWFKLWNETSIAMILDGHNPVWHSVSYHIFEEHPILICAFIRLHRLATLVHNKFFNCASTHKRALYSVRKLIVALHGFCFITFTWAMSHIELMRASSLTIYYEIRRSKQFATTKLDSLI